MVSAIKNQNDKLKLSVSGVSTILARQGLIDRQTQELINQQLDNSDPRHPITQIAALGLHSTGEHQGPLSAEIVTRATARHFNLPYTRIDPLKIDVAAVT